jgi:zinc D-Ala-D-Ala carboxypeptidase
MGTPSRWEYFSVEEFACRCSCGRADMNADFMDKAVRLRKFWGRPLIVTSAFRCPGHNIKVSTTGPKGPHTTGRAMDFGVSGADCIGLLECALKLKCFTGFGLHQRGPMAGRFLHIDDLLPPEAQPRPWVWTY